MSKKQALPLDAEGKNASVSKIVGANALKRDPVVPKENPHIQAERTRLREESLENLFTFLHVNQD